MATNERICRQLRNLTQQDFQQIMAAAESGNAIAQFNLAICYLYGQTTNVDFNMATEWLMRAAQQGDQMAGLFLGYMNELGLGRANNYAQAIYYYKTFSPSMGHAATQTAGDVSRAERLREEILRIKHFCIFFPKDGTYKFKWPEETRTELKQRLEEFNPLAEKCLENIRLAVTYDVCNALYGRDHLCRFIHEADLPAVEMEKDFEYALGRCLVDDNQADHDTVIAGIRLIAGHDNDSYWTLKAERWAEMNGGSQQATQELMMTGVDVDGDAVLGQPRNYPPFWEKYKAEQDRCRERSSAWSQRMKSDSEYFTAQDNDRRRQEEARRAQEEFSKRQQEEESWRRQQQATYNQQSQSQTKSGQGGLLEDLKTRALALMDNVKQLSTKWKWIWGIVIFCVIAYAWQECSNKGQRQREDPVIYQGTDTSSTPGTPKYDAREMTSVSGDAVNIVKQVYQYLNQSDNRAYYYFTPECLNKIKVFVNEYGLGFIFYAYPPGTDLYMKDGPIYSQAGNRVKVDFVYSFPIDGQNQNITNSVYYSFSNAGGKYLISDFEVVDNVTNYLQKLYY